jgi:SAM-dependent methyltransferase
VSATWHPLSAIFVPDPPMLATRTVLSLLLRAGGPAEVLYAGDRMGAAVPHGTRVRLAAERGGTLRSGDVVITASGPPDLVRVERAAEGTVWVTADADPAPASAVRREDVLAVADLRRARPGAWRRGLARAVIDLREAASRGPDPGADPAASVRSKYAAQSAFYAASPDDPLPDALRERIRAAVPGGGRILVAGSGAGREAVALARLGYRVRGVDFAAEMVEQARALARREAVEAEFVHADLRRHHEPEGALDAVFFTYDVYSFVPAAEDRVATLRRMRGWIRPGGVVLLSARRLRPGRDAAMLALSWLARGGTGSWGDTHTRWIAADGSLRRSFLHVFPAGALAREVAAAGFRAGSWSGGHVELRPAEGES